MKTTPSIIIGLCCFASMAAVYDQPFVLRVTPDGTAYYALDEPIATNRIDADGFYTVTSNDPPNQMRFGYAKEMPAKTLTNQSGMFWVGWEVGDGCSEPTRQLWGYWSGGSYYITNVSNSITNWLSADYGAWLRQCEKEHWDSSEQTELTYTQSNYIAHIVWLGRTNDMVLESLCVKTNVRKWHYEKKKVYN